MDLYQDWRICDVCGDHTYCRKANDKDKELHKDVEIEDLCTRCGTDHYKKYTDKQEVRMLYTALYELYTSITTNDKDLAGKLLKTSEVLKEIGETK